MFAHKLHNEDEIIALIIQGDEIAFAKLFEHYRDKIYSVALKLTQSVTIAEEVVEDVFLKIWLKRSDLINIQNFGAYLYTITRNDVYKALKQIAKNYNIVLLTEKHQLLSHNDTEDYVMEKEYSTILKKAIDRLPKQQKEVYSLIKEQGLKREEAANLLNLRPETVKFHLAQAMKNIRSFCSLHLNSIVAYICFLILPE